MSCKAIYVYPWDLADEGVVEVIGEVGALGIATMTIAGSYHAGRFLRPHGLSGRVFFPEDGTVYFKADSSRYGAITPVRNSLVRKRDIFRDATDNSQVAPYAWLVLLHNSRLGEQYSQGTVRNAFGDRYVYSQCPALAVFGG
jgi:hypothetical protein